jgi:Tfp pilus assembly protein PilF
VVAAAPDDADRDMQVMVSTALHGLGVRHLAAGRPDDARALLERALAVTERLYPRPHAQLAFSLGSLAYADEKRGDRRRALQLRQRQRDVLVATGASRWQIADVDESIARLRAS